MCIKDFMANILRIKKMRLFKIFFLAIIVIGCSKNMDEQELIPIANYENVELNCLFNHRYFNNNEECEYIIENNEELIEVAKEVLGDSLWTDCIDTCNLPLDFEEYILLGKFTKHDSNDILHRYVYKQNDIKRIIYKIAIEIVAGPYSNGGFGKIYFAGMNWVRIQKPPLDFEVIIEYEEY